MKTSTSLILTLLLTELFSGCATLSNREKILISTAAGVVVGGTIGYFTTPKDGSSPIAHAGLGGGLTGLGAAVAGLFVFNEQKKSSELESQINQLKRDLDDCPNRRKLIETYQTNDKPLPPHLRKIIGRSKVEEYEIDRWTFEETRGYHCDREIEYQPGAFGVLRPEPSRSNHKVEELNLISPKNSSN